MEKNENEIDDKLLTDFLEQLLQSVVVREEIKKLILQYENDDDMWVEKMINSIKENNQGG